MLIECFAAVQSLIGKKVPEGTLHHIEYQGPISEVVKAKIGYQFDGTLALLAHGWTDRQLTLLGSFPQRVCDGLAACRGYPQVTFMDDDAWYETYRVLLREFRVDDPDWQELLFRLWITRVLGYTVTVALRGYDVAMHHLHGMVERYARRSAAEARLAAEG
jgi:mannosylglycerate synthase